MLARLAGNTRIGKLNLHHVCFSLNSTSLFTPLEQVRKIEGLFGYPFFSIWVLFYGNAKDILPGLAATV